AANSGKPDEALRLAFEAVDAAPRASDREQIAWNAPAIASQLAVQHARGHADRFYRRTFALVDAWSPDTLQPLLNVSRNYPYFLMQQGLWTEVPPPSNAVRSADLSARYGEWEPRRTDPHGHQRPEGQGIAYAGGQAGVRPAR